MANSIIIRFQPKGDKQLLASLKALSKLQKELEGQIRQTSKSSGALNTAFERNRKSGNALGNTFSTMRSKMLLLSFAMSLGGRQLAQFGKQAAKMQAMETAFTNLQGGADNASVAMSKLRDATDGTMSNFDLFQQANNAMVLGITKNSDEMAEMFDMAQRLGRSLGVDTKRSVESLVTGIGRQSRLMLDNIGIVVKSDKAYEDYAKKLGIAVSKLTDTDKKQAFLNATLEAARQKISFLGEEVLSPIDSFDRLSASWENFTTSVGFAIIDVFQPLIDSLSSVLDFLDEERIKSYTTAVLLLAKGMGLVALATGKVTVSLKLLKTAIIGTGVGIFVVALGEIINALGIFREETTKTSDALDTNVKGFGKYNQSVLNVGDSISGLKNVYGELFAEIQLVSGSLALQQAMHQGYKKTVDDFYAGKKLPIDYSIEQINSFSKLSEAAEKEANRLLKEKNMLMAIEERLLQKIAQAEADRIASREGYIPKLQNEIALLELKTIYDGLELEQKTALLKAEQDELELDFVQQGQIENLIELKRILLDEIQEEIDLKKKQKQIEQTLQSTIHQALMQGQSDHMSYAESFGNMLESMRDKMVANAGIFFLFSGLGQIPGLSFLKPTGTFLENLFSFHQGGPIQGYNTGGMIPTYHSGGSTDNVPIMAQEGEFVIRRSAVESIGLENLNRMNRTGQVSGGANITFTGNIMSDSFIEEEAIPKIKDAIRRGADIGIS